MSGALKDGGLERALWGLGGTRLPLYPTNTSAFAFLPSQKLVLRCSEDL